MNSLLKVFIFYEYFFKDWRHILLCLFFLYHFISFFTFNFSTYSTVRFVSRPVLHRVRLCWAVTLRTLINITTILKFIPRVWSISIVGTRRRYLVLLGCTWEVFQVKVKMRVLSRIKALMLLNLFLILGWYTWPPRWRCLTNIVLDLYFVSLVHGWLFTNFASFSTMRAILITLSFLWYIRFEFCWCIIWSVVSFLLYWAINHVLRLKFNIKLLEGICLYGFLSYFLLFLLLLLHHCSFL